MNFNKKITLIEAKCGQPYNICEFCAKDLADKRLLDLGFTKGTRVVLVAKSFANAVFAVKIRNSVLCIRKKQAKNIWVK